MKHYVILLEEKRFLKETYYSSHFVCKKDGNEIPKFFFDGGSINLARKNLENVGFKNINGQSRIVLDKDGQKTVMPFPQSFLTLEEIAINDFMLLSIYRFDVDGSFRDSILFERVVSK